MSKKFTQIASGIAATFLISLASPAAHSEPLTTATTAAVNEDKTAIPQNTDSKTHTTHPTKETTGFRDSYGKAITGKRCT
ncbi:MULTISPECIES: hypothetical protein [unclassified Corynebacterium]|uniref:hypothetical protein n=1 Tax=unclassified Corynebacterium TaxID=2624378 RepID=UPI0029CA1A5D|nr:MULTISPECIES: hypothetical protein [unclassified Corynebacterium]WPF66039.1 hypothetical protein OLX12_10895 [Corynebacterium sp. 22KM0430]WPF68532.1 hypothetical protein OLW90_10890 [Corynebacterium sp. 21KM1197]